MEKRFGNSSGTVCPQTGPVGESKDQNTFCNQCEPQQLRNEAESAFAPNPQESGSYGAATPYGYVPNVQWEKVKIKIPSAINVNDWGRGSKVGEGTQRPYAHNQAFRRREITVEHHCPVLCRHRLRK